MKTGPSKSNDEKQETELVIKLNGQVVFERATIKNLTMLDTIGLVALTVLQPVLFQGLLTERDNLRQKQNTEGNYEQE